MKSIYLVAYYFQKPSNPRVKTSRPGWMNSTDNVSWDEQVSLTRNLKNRDFSTAKIILDLANRRVIKNGWSNGQDFDALYTYFEGSYPDYTTKVMEKLHPPVEVKTIDTSSTISSV